jgi:hypothetical protein
MDLEEKWIQFHILIGTLKLSIPSGIHMEIFQSSSSASKNVIDMKREESVFRHRLGFSFSYAKVEKNCSLEINDFVDVRESFYYKKL